ncbi:MAG: hypothetical protein KME28_08225 [Pelatocladus maniniholoensis HA4357-MV3]|jgi:hypothetical protein|uniref:Uncharacterized protein n=1 Tax=Pelatocladus maniniholoensis HA4357-MV3 TaxID=1117104 RepID=A0A9E3LT80_9NOST|nr:hypothetical protein [Pelatocladus maniniholoensis HA4357-MV3]BAZ66408.1 hypothetical protein NIES4106_11590 [Fischerella sp. NIES-4106]
MLSREQLELLSLEDLQAIGKDYGIQPVGNYSKRELWIRAIARFPYQAIDQMRDGVGMHHPGINAYYLLTQVLDMIGEPTDSQKALLKASDCEQWLQDQQWRFYQEKMQDLHRTTILIRNAIKLLVG